ncbi:MAG: translocation/assembly module TamB domain-containing protein [Desulfatiglans sp.]|jgi:translocation and assembly module TamB|nr:translocation/assembly module TamB domain-containing protein [Desulfatiglans sp.]
MDYRLHLKKTGKWIALTVALMTIVLLILWGLLQTDVGKQFLAQQISAQLAKKTPFHIKIGKITGPIPFTIRLDRLSISDSLSEWLVVERAFLSWSPASLIRGKISIKEMGAATVRLKRFPDTGKGQKTEKPKTMALPSAISLFHIRSLLLERLYLGESILGSQAVFTVSGRLTGDAKEALRGSFHIDRKDGAKELYYIDWSFTGQTRPELQLTVKAQEEKEGLLTRALGLKEAGSVDISLEGSGPISAWSGHLTAGADRLGTVETSLELTIDKGFRLKGRGHFSASQRVMEKDISSIIKSRKTLFSFDGQFHTNNDVVLHHLFFENDGITTNLAGRIDLEKREILTDFNIRIDDLSCLKEVMNSRTQGKLDLQGRVTGDLQQPEVSVSVMVERPGLGEMSASEVIFNASLRPYLRSFSDFEGLGARITGRVTGLTHKTRGSLIPGKDCRWFLDGEIKKGDLIEVNKLEISAEDFKALFSGQVNARSSSIHGHTSLDLYKLEGLSPIIGSKVRGSLKMDAYLEGNYRTRSLSGDIKGRMSRFGPLPALLAPLVKEDMTYACHTSLESGRHLRLTDLILRSAEVEMRAEVSLDLKEKGISAKGKLNIPSLAILSKLAERPLDGALHMEVDVSGALSAPTIKAHAAMRRVRMEDINIPEVSLSLLARNVPKKPEGDVQVQVQAQGYSLKADTDFSFIHSLLSLNNLSISAPGTEVTGDLKIRLQGPLFSGVLRGTSKDLLSASSLFGSKVHGKADFHVELSEASGRQDLVLDLHGQGLGDGHGTIETLVLTTRLKNLFGAPEGAAEIRIDSFQRGMLKIDHMILKAEGQKEHTAFTAHADGRYHEDFKFETVGSVESVSKTLSLRVSQLKGNLGGLAVSTRIPLIIRKTMDRYTLEPADFLLGEGRFSAGGWLESDSLALDARLDGLPLSLLHSYGYPELLGTATASIHIEGRTSHPKADIDLRLQGITLKEPAIGTYPPANLFSHMALQDHQFQASLSLEGLAAKPVRADFRLPLTLSLLPFHFSIKSQDRLKGQVFAEIGLERLTSLFDLEDHSMGGNLVADVAIEGSVARPLIRGHLRLSEGSYEYARSGTLIKDIQINASMIEERLILEEARATDGETGKIFAKGRIHLLPEKGLPLNLELILENSTLVRRDDLTFTANGRLEMSGSMEKTDIFGELMVGPAELRLPKGLPPEIKDLKVTEINLPPGHPRPNEQSLQKKGWVLTGDISLEIPGRFFIRGRGLDSEWKGKVRAIGSESRPAFTGSLSVVRGSYNFLGKPFSLTRGTFTFGGKTPPSPTFDIVAEYSGSDITYRILVTGDLADIIVNMESEPPMPSDEILSHLLFGRKATSITPFQAIRLAQAVNALTRGGDGGMIGFMDRTRKLMGVDELDIRQSDDEGADTSISIGKYMSDQVYIEVEQGIGADTGKVSIEIELTPRISVETDMETTGQSGVELNWKWDY